MAEPTSTETRTGANAQAEQSTVPDVLIPWILLILAVLAAIGAVLRLLSGEKTVLERVNTDTLVFLAVAGALLLMRNVKSLAFGNYKVEFAEVRKLVNEAKTAAEDAKGLAVGVGKSAPVVASDAGLADALTVATDDPHKNRFSGKSFDASTFRVLQAEVTRIENVPDLFEVHLEVASTRPTTHPLTGVVQFFLHPTFTNSEPIVHVGPGGVAELNLKAWGAFTVGALTDGGNTRLELDLAGLETAPPEFRAR
ncbi:MAG TPA: pYEATS domain-containing protein [Longimicrobium sp.]|nr:pYEATS domain-containing protein [Longimicrobium sp.]